jgi:hypothetical protein
LKEGNYRLVDRSALSEGATLPSGTWQTKNERKPEGALEWTQQTIPASFKDLKMEEEVIEGRQKHLNIKFHHFKEGIKKETNQHLPYKNFRADSRD